MPVNDATTKERLAHQKYRAEQDKKNAEVRKENEASEDKAVKEYAQRILHEPCIICNKKIPEHESFTELWNCVRELDSHKGKLESWFKANLKIGKTSNKSED